MISTAAVKKWCVAKVITETVRLLKTYGCLNSCPKNYKGCFWNCMLHQCYDKKCVDLPPLFCCIIRCFNQLQEPITPQLLLGHMEKYAWYKIICWRVKLLFFLRKEERKKDIRLKGGHCLPCLTLWYHPITFARILYLHSLPRIL